MLTKSDFDLNLRLHQDRLINGEPFYNQVRRSPSSVSQKSRSTKALKPMNSYES